MKPTTAQKESLSKYLYENLKYRETYTEFYDHILTALETKPGNMPFGDAIESIVKEDFGGYEGMSRIEARYQKEITKEVRKKYLEQVKACFQFPQSGITAIICLLMYWITIQPWFGFWMFIGLFFAMRMTPALLRRAKNIFSGFIFITPKISVKDGAFIWLDYISVIIFALFIIPGAIYGYSPIGWFKYVNPIFIDLFLVICGLHTIAYYKVYRNEFNAFITR